MSETRKLTFPQLRKVQLNNFSLYTLEPDIDIDIPDGVFCLAGANGLGKSTFLASVNFAITGIIPDPNREFKSVNEYYKLGLSFSDDFFTGRISEFDREFASIGVHLQIGTFLYKITRGIFEPSALREFNLIDIETGEILFEGSDATASQRQREFESYITKDIGLETFQQFVFLQHFVLTFDESRHLLLWDSRVLNQAMYLSIGADYSKAQAADIFRRDMERAGSRARNLSYQASNVRSRIEMLRSATQLSDSEDGTENKKEIDLDELRRLDESLREELSLRQHEVEAKRDQLDDSHLKWIEISSEVASLQNEYTKEFSKRLHKRSRVELHHLITASKSEKKCSICGTEGDVIVESIQRKIDSHECPLCDSPLPQTPPDSESLAVLKQIDTQISNSKKLLESAVKAKDRAVSEFKAAEDAFTAVELEIKEFEAANEAFLFQIRTSTNGVDATITKLQEEMANLIRQKKKEYSLRDEKGKELLKLQRELQQSYYAAEEEFVPLFQELASLFLGVDLQIRMDVSKSVASPNLSLTLEMRGISRREEYQLSESQRFFLDIALRMALAQYMSASQGKACLYVDTPEGSLDIAYESRAGKMFASFAQKGHGLIMTANINSSQLLRKLATDCGKSKMTLHRMTSWTELSDVQMDEERLFEDAYLEIEHALDSTDSTTHA